MVVKITIKKGRLKKIVRDTGVNYIRGAKTLLDRKIVSEMKKGKSPVKNGRWDAPYSQSYKDVLKGKVSFRKIKGATIPFKSPDLNIIGLGKRISPVNLKLSGQLHNSLSTIIKGFSLIIDFKDKLAKIHNKLGAGASKAIRRMLPTEKGEDFNDEIDRGLTKALANAVRKAIKNNTR